MQEQQEEGAGTKEELPFLQGKLRGRLMLYMEIGEIEVFKCVEALSKECSCDDCAFFNEYEGCMNVVDILGPCKKGDRLDRKDVIFVSTDPNEIIRERIEKSIDRLSGGDDDKMIALQSNAGECKIGFKASYWKRLLGEILKLEEEKEESKC